MSSEQPTTFQERVTAWLFECFNQQIATNIEERADRFIEEAFELVQSSGYNPDRIAALRDYVWSRRVGDPTQEVGGVMVTLAAYCYAAGLDMHGSAETELARILRPEILEKIRAKQASKPTGSALPTPKPTAPEADEAVRLALHTVKVNYTEDEKQHVMFSVGDVDMLSRTLLQTRADLDRLKQTSGEYHEGCGWSTLFPHNGEMKCLFCHYLVYELEARNANQRAEKAEAELEGKIKDIQIAADRIDELKARADHWCDMHTVATKDTEALKAELEREQGDNAAFLEAGDLAVWLLETQEFQDQINGIWKDWGDPVVILDKLKAAGFVDHNLRKEKPHPGAPILERLARAEARVVEVEGLLTVANDVADRDGACYSAMLAERDGVRKIDENLRYEYNCLVENHNALVGKLARFEKIEAEAGAGEPEDAKFKCQWMIDEWVAYARAQALALGVAKERIKELENTADAR